MKGMVVEKRYESDMEAILSHRHDNGADLWTTPDKRFLEAFEALRSKLVDGQIVIERVVPKLAGLSFCKKGQGSELATKRYHEILHNLRWDKER